MRKADNYENNKINEQESTRELHYIAGPMGLASIYVKQDSNDTMYYTHTDHLGSITEVTNKKGTLLQRMAYNAWGKRELLVSNTGNNAFLFDRGYTGHEHLDAFKLINMNGRLYDPVLGRMLSPDNFAQNSTQGLNRYSYCLNNPLKYTDPSGHFFILFPMVLAGIIAGDQMGYYSFHAGQGYWSGFEKGFAIGFITYGIGYGSGAALGSGILSSTISGALAGGFAGGTTSAAMGGNFWQGAKNGALIGGISGFAMGVLDKLATVSANRDFFNIGNEKMGINPGDPVPPTDKYLNEATDAWGYERPRNMDNYSIENVPEIQQSEMDAHSAKGVTSGKVKNHKITGRVDIYLNKNLIKSGFELFTTIGHEFTHAYQFSLLAGVAAEEWTSTSPLNEIMEYHAYSFNASKGDTYGNPFDPVALKAAIKLYPEYWNSFSYMNCPSVRSAIYIPY